MEILYILLPIVLISVIIAVVIFFWATNSGQFDDLDSPALSIFDENDELEPNQNPAPNNSNNGDDTQP